MEYASGCYYQKMCKRSYVASDGSHHGSPTVWSEAGWEASHTDTGISKRGMESHAGGERAPPGVALPLGSAPPTGPATPLRATHGTHTTAPAASLPTG
jgi:hypothetical protein